MGEIENNNKFQMQLIDKLIVSMIGLASLIVIIVTIVFVNNKYKKLYEYQIKQLSEIPYNETYRYLLKDNTIKFYRETKVIAEYKCSSDCKITDFSSSQFIIDNDDLVPVVDNGKVNLYSISNKKNSIVLDETPRTSINNKYGIIKMNSRYGVINKKGKIILSCDHNDIDINISHIVTLNNGTVYVYDDNAKLLASQATTATGDISISEKNNHLYINIVSEKTTTLTFDTRSNRFMN